MIVDEQYRLGMIAGIEGGRVEERAAIVADLRRLEAAEERLARKVGGYDLEGHGRCLAAAATRALLAGRYERGEHYTAADASALPIEDEAP